MAPNLSTLPAPTAAQLTHGKYRLWLKDDNPFSGIRTASLRRTGGQEITATHEGAGDNVFKDTIGETWDGSMVVHGGLFSKFLELQGITGYGSTFYGFLPNADGDPHGWMTIQQKSSDGLTLVQFLLLEDFVPQNLPEIIGGGATEELTLEIPFRAVPIILNPLVYPKRQIFAMDGVDDTVTLDPVPKVFVPPRDEPLYAGPGLLVHIRHRLAADTKAWGGTNIDAQVAVDDVTGVVDLGFTPANGDKIDAMWTPLLSAL